MLECVLTRKQPFRAGEVALVQAFVDSCQDVEAALGQTFEQEVLRALPVRVVARAAGSGFGGTLLRVLEQLVEWAAWRYEGNPISAAVGIDPDVRGSVDLETVWDEAFAPVLSNGLDTLLVVDPRGRLARLRGLPSGRVASFAPYRFHQLAEWAHGGRIAVSLTRTGEILLFEKGALRFALRGGHWHHYTHEAAIAALPLPRSRRARRAVYETLLDVSFARTGRCLAVVERSKAEHLSRLVAAQDLLRPPPPVAASAKANILRKAIGERFVSIDRRLRAELLALDGATIRGSDGLVIAVGAIARIEAGSAGGGRLAAARTLATLGLGVKISQDGEVLGFDGNGDVLFEYG